MRVSETYSLGTLPVNSTVVLTVTTLYVRSYSPYITATLYSWMNVFPFSPPAHHLVTTVLQSAAMYSTFLDSLYKWGHAFCLAQWLPLLTCTSAGDTQTLKGRSGSVSEGPPGAANKTKGFVWALRGSLVGMGFDFKCDFAPPTVLLWLLLCPWTWGICFWWELTYPVDGRSAASCNFGILAGEDERTSFCSTTQILNQWLQCYSDMTLC